MSYFYGRSVTGLDTSVRKHSRRNSTPNLGRKSVPNDYDIEPAHGSRHRHKHSTNGGAKGSDYIDGNPNVDEKISLPTRNKGRHHRHVDETVDDNRRSATKHKDSGTLMADIVEELKDKKLLLSKAKNKYGKLEKIFQEVQIERDKLKALLEQRDAEYSQLQSHEENLSQVVETLNKEKLDLSRINKKYCEENAQYREDVSLLKILIYRLNVEIERYQDKLRISQPDEKLNTDTSAGDETDIRSENKIISESWGRVNLHALGPLLEAYQENLNEKEELIKQYGVEINHFSGRCKEIVAENDTLRVELENLRSQYEKCTNDMKMLSEDVATVKEENDLLIKQSAMQKQKIQDIHSLYEKKVESMSQDNNKLHSDYLQCTTELSNLRGKYEILNDGYEKMKGTTEKTMPVSVHTSMIDECKRLFEELKMQYESEKKKMADQIKRLEESNPNNERQLVIVTADRDQLRRQAKNLEKTVKRTERKLQHLQQNVCSIQISRDSFKRQLNKVSLHCQQLIAEQEKLLSEREKLIALLTEREKENENIQYLGNNIVHRMGNLKTQLQNVKKGAKEQLETVEKHMKSQEKGVGQLKTDYNRELQRLKQLVKQKEEVIGKLQREKYATQDNLELVWRAATSDDKKVQDALKNTKIYNV